MASRHHLLAILGLACASAHAAVDPALLGLVMPGAKVLYGVQVKPVLASPFGQFALSRVPRNGAVLLDFGAAIGFDILRDLDELLLASPAPAANSPDGVILARGAFQPERFEALARASGAASAVYRGVMVTTPPGPGTRSFAFLDSSTLAIGNEAVLHGVIDRRSNPAALNGTLAEKAQAASAAGDVWLATVTPLAELVPANRGNLPTAFIQSVVESSAGLRFGAGGVTLLGEALTHSASEADALAGVFRFIAGMAKGPQAAVMQAAQITTNGAATRISLSLTEQDLERMFPSPQQGRAAR